MGKSFSKFLSNSIIIKINENTTLYGCNIIIIGDESSWIWIYLPPSLKIYNEVYLGFTIGMKLTKK